jgi:hypothetical protein
MYVPVFRKTVTFSNFPGIAIAIGSIVPFDKSCVNHLANRRSLYRSLDLGFAAKYSSQINLNHSAFPACFVNNSIFQALAWNAARTFGTATFAGRPWRNFCSISLQNSLFIRFVLIRCNQIHNTTIGSFLKISHEFLNAFYRAFARYNADYQTMLRIISYMVPVISLLTVSRIIVVTMFFFLAYKGPFLIKLNFSGLWGKTLPTHREALWRVCRLQGYTVLPYLGVRLQDGWSYARRNFRLYGLTERSFFPQAVAVQTAVCLFAGRIASCRFGSIAAECGYFCRTSRILSDYLHRVFHNLGIFYFDNRILKELALSCLLNVNCLWDNHLSLIQDIDKTT